MTRVDLVERADSLRRERVPFVLATVVRAERPTSAKPGDAALVLADGTMEGFVGGTCAEATVRVQSLAVMETGESTLLLITPDGAPVGGKRAGEGQVTVANPCLSGGTLEIFLEPSLPAPLVVVHGEAPIARALLAAGAALGFDAREASEDGLPADATAVVVASHGRGEEEIMTAALTAGVPYIGLVASARRGAAVLAALDLRAEDRARVRTPAGLDIGARTPSEVALSVLAEIVAVRPRRPSEVSAPVTSPPVTATTAIDLVCGMTVAMVPASLQLDHEGEPVWFCGPGCRDAFADDPDRYLPA